MKAISFEEKALVRLISELSTITFIGEAVIVLEPPSPVSGFTTIQVGKNKKATQSAEAKNNKIV